MRLLLSLLLFATLAMISTSEKSITSYTFTSFTSCAPIDGDGDTAIQFRIIGTDLDSATNCTFLNSNGEYFYFLSLFNNDEVLCVSVSLEAGEYMAGVGFENEIFFNPSLTNITITESPISANASVVIIESDSYLAGEDIFLDVISLTTCDTQAKCDDGDNATFTIAVAGLPSLQMIFQEKIGDTCRYLLPLTTKGVFNYQIFFNETAEIFSSVIEISTGVTTIDPDVSYVDASNISAVVSAQTACFTVVVLDSFSNTVENLEGFQFELQWKDLVNSLVENTYLASSNDGSYLICFEPSISGELELEVSIDGNQISNSPAKVTVSPGSFVAANSWIRDASLCPSDCDETATSSSEAGKDSSFVIVPRDFYGNEKPDSSDVNLSLFEGHIISDDVFYNMTASLQGNYVRLTYNAKIAGTYNAQIKYNGINVDDGRTPSVNVFATDVDFTECILTSNGNSTVETGLNILTTVSAFDTYGNEILLDTKWTSEIRPSSGKAIPCTMTNPTSNQYRSTCNATIAKSYTIVFLYDGKLFTQSRAVTIVPGPVSASNSEYGDYSLSVIAGESSTITIYTYDRYLNTGGIIQSFQKFLIEVQLQGDGKQRIVTDTVTKVTGKVNEYTVNFVLTVAGKYDVSVSFIGSPLIAQQSQVIEVTAAPTQGPYCTLELLGEPIAAQIVWFELQARDQYGNLQTINEIEDFSVTATQGELEITCEISLTETSGIYNVTFIPTVAGQYQVLGLFKEIEPFSVTEPVLIKPGPISPVNSGFAAGSSGQSETEAGTKSLILIQGRDAADNRVEISPGDDEYLVVLTSESRKRDPIEIIATKENSTEAQALNGITVYSYVAAVAGTYTVSITKNGAHISGSPSTLVVSSSATYDESFTITGPESMKVGESIIFTLTISDIYGNPVDGKDDIDVDLIGIDNGAIVRLQPNFSPGKYVMPFTAEIGGRYNLVISWNGAVLPNSPVLDVFANDGGECTTFDGPINQGQKWDLVCIAYDEFGKEEKAGGATISVDAPKASFSVVDKNDGSYIITYSSQRIGKRSISITINGKPVKEMPYTIAIIPGSVVLGTVIPSMFVFGLILVAAFVYYRKRKQKKELLLKKKRKPQQVFEVGDFEEEWSDEEEHGEQEENWFSQNMDKDDRLKAAHEMTIKSLAHD